MRASPVPLTKVRIWSVSSCTSSPISPSGGMVMITSWLCSPVQSTRRKSALFSASVAMVKWMTDAMDGAPLASADGRDPVAAPAPAAARSSPRAARCTGSSDITGRPAGTSPRRRRCRRGVGLMQTTPDARAPARPRLRRVAGRAGRLHGRRLPPLLARASRRSRRRSGSPPAPRPSRCSWCCSSPSTRPCRSRSAWRWTASAPAG